MLFRVNFGLPLPHPHPPHNGHSAVPSSPAASAPAPGSAGSAGPPHSAHRASLGQSRICKQRRRPIRKAARVKMCLLVVTCKEVFAAEYEAAIPIWPAA